MCSLYEEYRKTSRCGHFLMDIMMTLSWSFNCRDDDGWMSPDTAHIVALDFNHADGSWWVFGSSPRWVKKTVIYRWRAGKCLFSWIRPTSPQQPHQQVGETRGQAPTEDCELEDDFWNWWCMLMCDYEDQVDWALHRALPQPLPPPVHCHTMKDFEKLLQGHINSS